MDLLFSYVGADRPHGALLSGYFCKVVICLLVRRTHDVMRYFQNHREYLKKLVDLIGITSIMEVSGFKFSKLSLPRFAIHGQSVWVESSAARIGISKPAQGVLQLASYGQASGTFDTVFQMLGCTFDRREKPY
jgi:hypothetical protein